MQSDSQLPEPAQPDAAAPLFSPRRLAWLVGALLLALILVGALWAVRTWQTNRAIANVESSLAGRTMPAGVAAAAGAAAATTPKAVPEEGGAAAPAVSTSGERLPPLMLPGQPVPAAVLRDLPEWVVAEVAPAQTSSGASGDESAAPAAPPAPPAQGRQHAETAPQRERKDRYGSVFARCPGPGESGAVECRRAVCAGAARKAASCVPYRD